MSEAGSKATRFSSPEVPTVGHLAYIDGFREQAALCRGQRAEEHDSVLLFSMGTRHARYFNGVFRIRNLVTGPQVIDSAERFFAERADGYTVLARTARDEDLVNAAYAAGLQLWYPREPHMVCVSRVAGGALPSGFELRPLTPARMGDFVDLEARVYGDEKIGEDVYRQVLSDPSHLLLPHMRVVIAVEADRMVGAGILRLSHGVGFLYWIATAPEARRQGVGSAITAELTNAAFDAGSGAVYLQASAQGEPMYKKLGFVERGAYCWLQREF